MGRNKSSVFANIGASSHSSYEREQNDYYSTSPVAVRLLDKYDLLDKNIPYWETACGGGSLGRELKRLGYDVVRETDLFDRGYGDSGVDFLKETEVFQGNTITNPPYSLINDWILKSLEVTSNKAYIFCRIQTLETIGRWKIFKNNPPSLVCPFVKRVKCYLNGVEKDYSSAVCYSWFIWDMNDDSGVTKIKWLI